MDFFEILSNGFGSVIGGLFTALIVAGGLLYLLATKSRNGAEPIALICCGLLFCFLFYQFTLMYAAFGYKSTCLDFITALNLQFGDEIDGETLRQNVTTAIRENPLIGFFIDYGDLEDFDWSQPIASARSVVAREFNWFIFRRIVWAAVFTLIFSGISFLTSGGVGNQHSRRDTSYNYDDDYDSSSYDSDNYDF